MGTSLTAQYDARAGVVAPGEVVRTGEGVVEDGGAIGVAVTVGDVVAVGVAVAVGADVIANVGVGDALEAGGGAQATANDAQRAMRNGAVRERRAPMFADRDGFSGR